jgi:extracellular elastinolytic metalloproteinase
VVGNLASRAPWDVDGKTGAPTNTTMGNNARTAESWEDGGQPGPNQFQPLSTARDYTFPWTNQWFTSDCNVPDPQIGQSVDVAAAVTNLFTMHNRMHDWSYLLGFTEDNWNAQSSNFGLTEPFRENDPVVGDTQAGAFADSKDRDNANMSTLPDGSSSITNMFLWQPLAGAFYAPCVDGDYDASVIGHEYTHMIENRTIGKGNVRSGFHAGSMGEAAGDLFAIEMLNEYGFVPTSDENPWSTGAYATGNKLHGIRDYAGNFPSTGAFPTPSTYPQVDPLNFSDIGFDVTGPEVHADGEIWIAANFELRRALAAKYNAQFPESDQALQMRCADGAQPVAQCPGNRRWIQLLFDSFLLDPTAPSMVDARNSILAADQMRFGDANQNEIWGAFARRGLGDFASSTNGSGRTGGVESDTNPIPDFRVPGAANNATVKFAAVSRQAPEPAVNARIFVGHYEARVSPIADTDPATNAPAGSSANNLDDTGFFAPGTYEFVATAPGYGEVRFRRTFRAGQNQTITLHLAPNWASKNMGSTASGDAVAVTSPFTGNELVSAAQVRNNLIDDSEATDWQAPATQVGPAWEVDGRQVTVDLGGTSPVRINRVQVSAMLALVFDPGARPRPADLTQNRFTAVRRFEIDTCNARVADCSQDDSYQRAYLSPADAFPADAPRPVAPMLLMREFRFSPVQATHVRIVVRSSQCTAGPAYQGEQDADPANATDCNEAGPASTHFVRVAELQAFSQPSTVTVATG